MYDYQFYRTVYDMIEADLSSKSRAAVRYWLDLCEQQQWHPLDYDPAKFRQMTVALDKHMELGLWRLLNYVRDNIFDCPEFRERWKVLFRLHYDPDWEPEDELMSLEDIHPTLPPPLQEQPPFSPPPPVPEDQPVKPLDPPWKTRKAGHNVHHKPFTHGCDCGRDVEEHGYEVYGIIDDMTHVYWDKPNIQDIAYVGQDFADWAPTYVGDPLWIEPDAVAFYISDHPQMDRRFVWDSMFFILQYILTNSDHPEAFLPFWERFQRASLEAYERGWQAHLDALRDHVIRGLGGLGWSPQKIARLTFGEVAGCGDISAELQQYITKLTAQNSPNSTDRVFSLSPGAVMKILERRQNA